MTSSEKRTPRQTEPEIQRGVVLTHGLLTLLSQHLNNRIQTTQNKAHHQIS